MSPSQIFEFPAMRICRISMRPLSAR
jgi:hypothetical protein